MALAVAVWAIPVVSVAAGLYEDLSGRTAFLLSPHQVTVAGAATASRGGNTDGEIFALSGTFPVRPFFLVGISQPFVVASQPDGIDTALGDFVLRTRLRMYNRHSRSFSLLAGVGAGTGNTRLFPYSAQSLDFELTLAYVDSLATLHIWIEGGAVSVNRAPDNLPDDISHTDYARLAGGIVVPLGAAPELRLGGSLLRYESDARRDIAFAEFLWAYSPMLRFNIAAQAETGPESQRVSDYAITGGLTVRY